MKGNDVSVVNEDIQVILLGEGIEFVLKVFTVLDVLFQAENCPFLEINGLTDNLTKNVGIFKGFDSRGLNLSWSAWRLRT